MYNAFFWLALALAAADWAAVLFRWERVRWLAKPGALAALIAWFSLAGRWSGPLAFIGLGLVFSLIGDTLLLLPQRYFMGGMAAFFVAHLFTITGFHITLPPVLRWEVILPVLIVGAALFYLQRRVRCAMIQQGENAVLPFTVYGVVLSLMWLSTLLTLLRPEWALRPAILASLGGSLFFLSDAVLACCRFMPHWKYGDLVVMVTYHLAQFLIAAGTLEQFL